MAKRCANCGAPQPVGVPEYMLTYGDMVTLILCFFVILYSTGKVDPQKFQLVLSSFKGSFYMLTGGKTFSEAPLMDMGQQMTNLPAEKSGEQLDESANFAVSAFQAEIKDKRIRITTDERGIVITFATDVYFEPSDAELKKDMKSVLQKLAAVLKTLPNYFRVEGHTDNSRIPQAALKEFPTNWDLAAARSLNVLKYLAENDMVKPERISAASYGEYRPLESNDTPEGRALNRRVDFIILRDQVGRKEKPKSANATLDYLKEVR